ncbi:MAG: glycosyltransferase family 4 protein, partial [Spirochaetota bacterium]|nr:glycosyltransferase family 4 protein [Spirochaetota bacterium]
PSIDYGLTHSQFKDITIYHSIYDKESNKNKNVRLKGFNFYMREIALVGRAMLNKYYPDYRVKKLIKVIKHIKPDVIHSLEFQHAGYLVLEAKKRFKGIFPHWHATPWGSDIFLFGRLKEHQEKINALLLACDSLSLESQRDIELAKHYGFKGKDFPPFPQTCGFHLKKISIIREKKITSERKYIMLKGYQGWAGRSLVGLRALERCADIIQGYQIILFSAHTDDIKIAAELFSLDTNITVKVLTQTDHESMLNYFAQSRIAISLSISDGLPNSFVEALAMGAFPIQSYTSCANEWIKDGITGFLVPPNDPDIVEQAIRKALTDDNLVNQAAELNWKTIQENFEYSINKNKAIRMYQTVYKKGVHQ